jgi:hypothetical protein
LRAAGLFAEQKSTPHEVARIVPALNLPRKAETEPACSEPDTQASTAASPSSLLDYLPEKTGIGPQGIPVANDTVALSSQQTSVEDQVKETEFPGSNQSEVRVVNEEDVSEDTDDTPSTAESRAEFRKQQVLAKVAQEHENVRQKRFVFGRPGATPTRTMTPTDMKKEGRGGEAGRDIESLRKQFVFNRPGATPTRTLAKKNQEKGWEPES